MEKKEKKRALKEIPKSKIKAVKEMVDLIKTKKTILVADISNIPGSQFQQIGKKLRGKAIVKVPKKNLFFRAIEDSKKEGIKELKKFLAKPIALLFSDLDSYELAGELIRNKSPAKAKSGQIAPINLEVPAGPTDLIPGPAISEMGALGIQIQIKGGKIEVKQPKIITKESEVVSEGAAAMLSKLGIMPFTIGFIPISSYDSEEDKIYAEIMIDPEGVLDSLKLSFSKALAFAVTIGHFNSETLPLLIQKAGREYQIFEKLVLKEPEEPKEISDKDNKDGNEEKKEAEEKLPTQTPEDKPEGEENK